MHNKKSLDSLILNLRQTGKGKTLILIHGIAGSYKMWDKVIPYLAKDNQVVTLDLMGYGHSPKPHIAYTPKAHITAIRNSLRFYNIKPPYYLIGLSMGVNLALEYAATWPSEVAGFIGIGFPYYADTQSAKKGLHHNIWTRLSIEHRIMSQIVIPPLWWLARHQFIPTKYLSTIYTPAMTLDSFQNPYYAFKSTLYNCMLHNPQNSLLEETASIDKLFIHGSNDKWATVKEIKKALVDYPKTQIKVINNAEHNTALVAPKETSDYILQYLSTK